MTFPKEPTGWRELLADLAQVTGERQKLLTRIEEIETSLKINRQDLQQACERVREEEYAAAQADGGLAIASQEAQKKVADCELTVKTLELRLAGLRKTLAPIEAGIASDLLPRLNALSNRFLDDASEALSRECDAAIGALVTALCKAVALNQYRRLRGISTLSALAVANPVTGWVCLNGPFLSDKNGHSGLRIDTDWESDSGARDLHEILSQMRATMAPFEKLVKEIGQRGK